jgi:hypothetical protein
VHVCVCVCVRVIAVGYWQLKMALGPVGPFCPFRGDNNQGADAEIDRQMGLLSYQVLAVYTHNPQTLRPKP